MQAAPDISETLETTPTHQPLAPNVDGSWHYFVAHSIKVSRATFAVINNDVMKLLKAMDVRRARNKKRKIALTICGPFAIRHFKSKKTVAKNNRFHDE